MIYVISPYSHPNGLVRAERSRKAGKVVLALAEQGIHAVSPVFFGHEFETKFRVSLPYEFWLDWSRQLMVACRECYLLPIPGWRESRGVEDECKLATELHLPITGYALGEDDEQVNGMDIRRQFGLPIVKAARMRGVFAADA